MPEYETYTEDDEEEPDYYVIDPEDCDDYELEGCLINQELNLAICRAFEIICQCDDDDLIVVLPDRIKQKITQLITRSIRKEQYNEPLKVLKS